MPAPSRPPAPPPTAAISRPAQFARRFGATAAQIGAVRRSLRARGLTPGAVSRGALSISVVASAAQLEHAFSVSLTRMAAPRRAARRSGPAPRPPLPASLAGAVQSVVGLNTTAAPRPLLVRARPGSAPARARGARVCRGHVVTGGPQPCAAASAAAPGQQAFTADQIASAYGFSGLYGAGDSGAGVTVAVYELEPDDPVRHRRLPVLLRHPRHDLLRAGRPGRRNRAGQRRGGAGHREPHRPGPERQRARLPGPELQLGRPGLGPLRHLQRDHQPGPRPRRHRLLGPVRGRARPGRCLRREHAV